MAVVLESTVAKKEPKEYVTYPCRFEKPLYEALSEYCEEEEILLSQYIRKLVKKDLQEKGKFPLKS